MSITSGEPGIAETLSFTLWSLDSRVPEEAQKHKDHELTHTGSLAVTELGLLGGFFLPSQ